MGGTWALWYALAHRWHLGHISWATALRSGALSVTGPRELVRALPTWNRRPEIGLQLRAARRQAG
jgi:hypothetical protein